MFAGMIDTFMWDKGTPQQRMATPLETVQILDEIDRCTACLTGPAAAHMAHLPFSFDQAETQWTPSRNNHT